MSFLEFGRSSENQIARRSRNWAGANQLCAMNHLEIESMGSRSQEES